jgi:hypothetical protein
MVPAVCFNETAGIATGKDLEPQKFNGPICLNLVTAPVIFFSIQNQGLFLSTKKEFIQRKVQDQLS